MSNSIPTLAHSQAIAIIAAAREYISREEVKYHLDDDEKEQLSVYLIVIIFALRENYIQLAPMKWTGELKD